MIQKMGKEKKETRRQYQRGTQHELSEEERSVLCGLNLLKAAEERSTFLAAVKKSVRDKLIALKLVCGIENNPSSIFNSSSKSLRCAVRTNRGEAGKVVTP